MSATATAAATAAATASLDDDALARRLAELAGDERAVQVEFLLHLAELDRREAWLSAGYGSLWDYCRRVLHLREGAAWRRIQAMRPSPELTPRAELTCPAPISSFPAPSAEAPASAPAAAARPTVRPVAADTWSLRVTVDAAFKQELDRLTELLSHRVPTGDLAAVLREAVKCAIEKHGKRQGAVEPARRRARRAEQASVPAATQASPRRQPIPAEVRRQVWTRDEGRCAWVGPDGHRCGSRWRLEVDHLVAAALGGPSTLPNLRLACDRHNRLHAEQTFGRAFMDRFRRERPRAGETAAPGGSGDAS